MGGLLLVVYIRLRVRLALDLASKVPATLDNIRYNNSDRISM